MERIAIFAHFDKNNIVEEYVQYYLKELEKVVSKIIFVSDSDLLPIELSKIESYVDTCIVGKHGEYDFGSYKKGYNYAKEHNLLDNCDELVFVNDSCYAPLFPFSEIFNNMSNKKDIDFWGNTANRGFRFDSIEHIQSYFIVFRPIVFKSIVFDKFMNAICKQNEKNNIIGDYEVGLTDILTKNGFKHDVYCNYSKSHQNTTQRYVYELIKKDRCPFLKRKIHILDNQILCNLLQLKKFITQNTNYDYKLIQINKIDYNLKNIYDAIYILVICYLKRIFLKGGKL